MPKGVFRRVLLVHSVAVKLPRLRHLLSGMRCNRWEREMWRTWRPQFDWCTLCPVVAADPFGLFVVMRRATQPVDRTDIDQLPDYYPSITAELKPDDYGWLDGQVVAVDYGLFDRDDVLDKQQYYQQHAHKPATIVPNGTDA